MKRFGSVPKVVSLQQDVIREKEYQTPDINYWQLSREHLDNHKGNDPQTLNPFQQNCRQSWKSKLQNKLAAGDSTFINYSWG